MPHIFTACLLAIVLFGCGTSPERPAANKLTADGILANQADSVHKYAQYYPDNVQLSLALIRDGQVTYYGVKRVDDTLTTIENSGKAFEIGSLTKVLTSTVLADYVVRGELALDDTINEQFPFPFKDSLKFTFRELANHTSGLPRLPSNIMLQAVFNRDNPYSGYDKEKLDAYLKNDMALEFGQGEKSSYSNLGVGLLSYSLRRYSGKSFEELVAERIFDRYDMAHSSSDRTRVSDILVEGLGEDGRPTPNWESGALIGAGGVYSTVEDLAKFALAQFDTTNVALTLTRVKTFQENEYRDVGLGWFIINRKDGAKWYWHNGGTGGYTSSMVLDVDQRNGVILLSNISSYHKHFANIDRLCFSLMRTLQAANPSVPVQ